MTEDYMGTLIIFIMNGKEENNNSSKEVFRMVDITEISAMVAAAGVMVGVVYYILDMDSPFIARFLSTSSPLSSVCERVCLKKLGPLPLKL